MRTKNQEVSFEVATKNETVTVAVQPPALADELPPLTPEPRELLKQAHPSLQAQIERNWRRKNQREQQSQPTTAPTPTTTTTPPAYKLQPHEEEFLKKAKSQKERDEIWTAIRADRRMRERNQLAKEIQQSTIQRNHRQPTPNSKHRLTDHADRELEFHAYLPNLVESSDVWKENRDKPPTVKFPQTNRDYEELFFRDVSHSNYFRRYFQAICLNEMKAECTVHQESPSPLDQYPFFGHSDYRGHAVAATFPMLDIVTVTTPSGSLSSM